MREAAALIVASLVAIVHGACEPPFPGGPRGHETVVENRTDHGVVVLASDYRGEQYFPVAPGASVAVDWIGEANVPADRLALFDQHCQLVRPDLGDFPRGGLIVVEVDGVTSEPTRLIRDPAVDPDDVGLPSCDTAAEELR